MNLNAPYNPKPCAECRGNGFIPLQGNATAICRNCEGSGYSPKYQTVVIAHGKHSSSKLPPEESHDFASALLNPPTPNNALRKAHAQYKRTLAA